MYLFATWGYKQIKGMTDSLFKEYTQLAAEIQAEVVPVGPMWDELKDSINLYDGDGAHPNRKGTFINTCLCYEYLFQENSTEIQHSDDRLDVSTQRRLKRWAHEFRKTNVHLKNN